MIWELVSTYCPHGYRLTEQDNCEECVRLLHLQAEVMGELESLVIAATDDAAIQALACTAINSYVVRRLVRPELQFEVRDTATKVLKSGGILQLAAVREA
jgi:hypothetical protein